MWQVCEAWHRPGVAPSMTAMYVYESGPSSSHSPTNSSHWVSHTPAQLHGHTFMGPIPDKGASRDRATQFSVASSVIIAVSNLYSRTSRRTTAYIWGIFCITQEAVWHALLGTFLSFYAEIYLLWYDVGMTFAIQRASGVRVLCTKSIYPSIRVWVMNNGVSSM